MKLMETRTNIERFKKAVENNKFTMQEELTFVEILVTKYNFISKSEFARQNNITPQGVESRLKSSSTPYLKMLNKLFIVQ